MVIKFIVNLLTCQQYRQKMTYLDNLYNLSLKYDTKGVFLLKVNSFEELYVYTFGGRFTI